MNLSISNARILLVSAILAMIAGTTALAQSGAYFQAVTNLNPIGYWPLNETNPPPASKPAALNLGYLGPKDNGTYFDGAFPGVPGALAGDADLAAVFTGAYAAAMQPPYAAAYAGLVPFTVEVWFNSAIRNPPLECIVASMDSLSPRAGWLIYADGNSAGTFNFRLYNQNGLNTSLNLNGAVPGGVLQSNTWYYVAATFDGAIGRLYINGALAGSGTATLFNGKAYVPSTYGPFSLGARSDNQNFESPGYEDEAAFYSNVLSAADILAHYRAGANPDPNNPYSALVLGDHPALYYRLDEAPVPVAANYGSLGAFANGYYESGTMPGVAGPNVGNFGASNFACAFRVFSPTLSSSVAMPGMAGLSVGTGPRHPVALAGWINVSSSLTNSYETAVRKGLYEYAFFEDTFNGSPWFISGAGIAAGNRPVNDDHWHLWVGQWDGTNETLYIDGQLAGTIVMSSANSDSFPLAIGTNPSFSGSDFVGSVCQVAVFTNVLSATQIQQLFFAAGVPPLISAEPASVAVNSGQNASFSVTVLGTPLLAYQWYRGAPVGATVISDGTNIFGSTSNVLTFLGAQGAQDDNYFVVVTNSYGATTSSVVTLTVFVPGPAVVTNLAAANIQTKAATLVGQILSPGTNSPAITFYYGTNDSGTNAGGWANNIYLGVQIGTFSQTVTGLFMNTTYYFTASATNSAGTAWASPSQSFATLAPSLAVVTNLAATSIQTTGVTLNGQVVNDGGDTPTITIYYGTNDGGTNVAAWATNVSIGLQDGIFAQTVSGLSPNTGYFFAAEAVNGAGAAWASPSGSFTTLAITLATLTNLPAAAIQTRSATIGGRILNIGNDAPSVSVFYGTNDGGTNAGSWAQSNGLGVQTGTFSQALTNLLVNTAYYFSAAASNGAGTSWASPSRSFTTLAITPATLTNLPATMIQATSATLNGVVLSNGNDTPMVTLFYGPSDGGTNAGAWAQAAALGLQSDSFVQPVSGLSTNTTYFFTARAVNGVGAVWATPSLSFTTPANNPPVLPVAVLTQHNDNGRTGMNLNETVLNTGSVNTNGFGLLYTRPVDDQIYAQPLVATDVNLPVTGIRNLLILCTVNDTIYAYDADDSTVTAPYWTNSFINPPNIVPPRNTDMSAIGACGGNYQDFTGNIGIVGTPVIDAASGAMFVVVRTKENGSTFVQKLHALDLTTGLDGPNSPVVITATYPGTGADNVGGVLTFDPLRQNQRTSLVLANGWVYVTWSSHCDQTPYHGWVIGYKAGNLLAAPLVYNASPNGNQDGIWMSNQGPLADTNGGIYLSTGNGDVDAADRGESYLKLTTSGTNLNLASFFTAFDWSNLNGADQDISCGGLLLIPNTPLILSGGKAGRLYLINKDNMGGLGTNDNIAQEWDLGPHSIHGGPVWWDGPNGSFAYIWGAAGDHLRQYQFNRAGTNQIFNTNAFAQSVTTGGAGQPGGILSLSANGTNAGSGIVWAALNTANDANQATVAGTLHAYDAQNVGHELWNSDLLKSFDGVGNFAKFVAPTVANGKVYLATFSNRLNVYGLFPRPTLSVSSSGGNLVLSWPANGFPGFRLQASTDLSMTNWLNDTNTVVATNGAFQVTIPTSSTATYFRLIR